MKMHSNASFPSYGAFMWLPWKIFYLFSIPSTCIVFYGTDRTKRSLSLSRGLLKGIYLRKYILAAANCKLLSLSFFFLCFFLLICITWCLCYSIAYRFGFNYPKLPIFPTALSLWHIFTSNLRSSKQLTNCNFCYFNMINMVQCNNKERDPWNAVLPAHKHYCLIGWLRVICWWDSIPRAFSHTILSIQRPKKL